jgi:hypothetical protein
LPGVVQKYNPKVDFGQTVDILASVLFMQQYDTQHPAAPKHSSGIVHESTPAFSPASNDALIKLQKTKQELVHG